MSDGAGMIPQLRLFGNAGREIGFSISDVLTMKFACGKFNFVQRLVAQFG